MKELEKKPYEAEKLIKAIRPCGLVMMNKGFESFSAQKETCLKILMLETAKALGLKDLTIPEQKTIIDHFTKRENFSQLGLTANPGNEPKIKEGNEKGIREVIKKLIKSAAPRNNVNFPQIAQVAIAQEKQ